jgi:hypothetical protein
VSRVNILKRVKIGARWKLLSIPRNDKGNPNWAALPEGRYFIEWVYGRQAPAGVRRPRLRSAFPSASINDNHV